MAKINPKVSTPMLNEYIAMNGIVLPLTVVAAEKIFNDLQVKLYDPATSVERRKILQAVHEELLKLCFRPSAEIRAQERAYHQAVQQASIDAAKAEQALGAAIIAKAAAEAAPILGRLVKGGWTVRDSIPQLNYSNETNPIPIWGIVVDELQGGTSYALQGVRWLKLGQLEELANRGGRPGLATLTSVLAWKK